MVKTYSQISIAIDLIQEEYNTSNPIIIAEKIKDTLGLSYTIHQIADYLDMDENFELESNKMYYNIKY